MARRMYDLGSGTEDIVVKDAKIVGPNGLEIIEDNDPISYHKVTIKSTTEGFDVNVDGETVFSLVGGNGTVYFALRLSNYPTISRPTGVGEGTVIYDSTLKKCILYNGTAWVNLDGTALA